MWSADPWQVDETDFPNRGADREKLAFLLNYAVLAPSSHNAQPWLFRLGEDAIDLFADRTRALPVTDPLDRELTISCGAALGFFEIAARHFGHAGDVALLPEAAEPDLLGRMRLGRRVSPTLQNDLLFFAMKARRTSRLRFRDDPLPPTLVSSLVSAADEGGARLCVFTDAARREEIAALASEGDRLQFADPAFRRELASWIHARRGFTRDGMSQASAGLPDLVSPLAALAVRTFDVGDGVAARDRAIAEGSPALAVLVTTGDAVADWLAAGRALARVLLTAAAAGASAGYLNQAIEVPALRERLKAVAGSGAPQLLLRFGYADPVPPSARRPVPAVLIADGETAHARPDGA